MLSTSAAQHITDHATGRSQQTLRCSCSVCSAGPPGQWLRRMQTATTPTLQARINHTGVPQQQPQLIHMRMQMLAAPVLGLGSSHLTPSLHTPACAQPQQHRSCMRLGIHSNTKTGKRGRRGTTPPEAALQATESKLSEHLPQASRGVPSRRRADGAATTRMRAGLRAVAWTLRRVIGLPALARLLAQGWLPCN